MHEPDDDECCQPGDITIAQVYGGWMLGRTLAHLGPGPWWSFIAILPDFDSALREARDLAAASGVRAWFHQGGTTYHRIPLDDSPFEAS